MTSQVKPLLTLNSIEAPPKYIQNLEDAGRFVKHLKETEPDIVSSAANRSGSDDDRRTLQAGLLYLALTEPDPRRSLYQDIVLTARDNLNYALSELTRLVAEAWPKMGLFVRKNLLSLLSDLIATRGASVELLMVHIYRRMLCGDLSSGNLWLIQHMLDLVIKNREWLEAPDRLHFILQSTVYTFLRLIPDHQITSTVSTKVEPGLSSSPTLTSTLAVLRQKESTFIVDFIRKNFDKVAAIGRDFIRLLFPLSRTEPFLELWNDIFSNISSLSFTIENVQDILGNVTHRNILQTNIPQEMEAWVKWLFRNVLCIANSPVRRYEEFFHKKYFMTPESQSMRVCLTRYIVGCFYPDNEMLASTLIPRWNFLAWILAQCTCPIACHQIKLVLFFDWLFFQPGECIMNVEPAMLMIVNHLSARSIPFSLGLLDFLTKTVTTFHPNLTENITSSVRAGLEAMINLGVIRSLSHLLDILLRASPDIYRNFTTLIGPLVDSTLPLPPVPSVSTPSTSFGSTSGGSVGSSAFALEGGRGGSVDGNKDPLPTRPSNSNPATTAKSGSLSRQHRREGAHGLPSSAPPPTSNGEVDPPLDPRLRRNTAPSVGSVLPSLPNAQWNGVNAIGAPNSPPVLSIRPPQPHQRPPSPPDMGRFSPPPVVPLEPPPPSPPEAKLKSLMGQRPPSPPVRKLEILPNNFAGLSSPEYRISTSTSGDSMQQRIDDLRRKFQSYQMRYTYKMRTDADVPALIAQFDGQVHDALENLTAAAKVARLYREPHGSDESVEESPMATPNSSTVDDSVLADMSEAMQILINSVLDDDLSDDLATAGRTADIVCHLCLPLFDPAVQHPLATSLPTALSISQEQVEASLASPIFVPLRYLCEMNRTDPRREVLLLLLTEMQIRQPRIGYHLLYILTVGSVKDEKMTAYRNFCASQENPNLLTCLYRDLQLLADDNRFLFCYLLPTIYSVFVNDLSNNTDFIHLIVDKIDPSQANYLVCEILRGHLNFFHRPNITDVLKASLEWDSIQQFFFWQLVNAHELPTKNFLPLISLMDGKKHPEACSHLLLLLQLEKPSADVIRLLLSRCASGLSGNASTDAADDLLSVTALHYWGCPGRQNAQRFAEILGSMVTTCVNGLRQDGEEVTTGPASSATSAKKRNGLKSGSGISEHLPLLISILAHLDCMRRKCKNIAMLEAAELQTALQQVIHATGVPPRIKDRFAELLSLVEDDAGAMETSLRSGGLTRGSNRHSETPSELSAAGSAGGNSGSGSSKGGHSLRNLDSRRAAEVERRRSATPGSTSSSKKARLDSDTLSDTDESDGGDDSVLAIDDNSPSVVPIPDASSATSSDTESDESDMEGKKRRGRGRLLVSKRVSTKRISTSSSVSKATPPPRRKAASTILPDSDDDSSSELGGDTGDDDKPISEILPPKRRKMVSRRLLDD